MALDRFTGNVQALVMVALVVAALALALDGFKDAIIDDDPCLDKQGSTYAYNTSSKNCYNTSSASQAELTNNFNYQYNATDEGLLGTANASSYLSTIGTLIGVAALIAIVVFAFHFARR